ncbi:MAG TPA: ergothioneine biosynthesis protein EgtB, partial [Candidatus Binatia bacterium]|nr:ergothioneine biosynthesis protein EgtB [Candidatus Binatia bacterium]
QFNSYYQGIAPPPPRERRGLQSRPSLKEVLAWREHVDAAIARLPSAFREDLLELGIQHEQQHQELILTDLKHAFFLQPARPAYRAAPALQAEREPTPSVRAEPVREIAWSRHQGGLVPIGHEGPGFAFDNEGPRHRVWLEPFELATRRVTNGEFMEFILDGGYQHPRCWLSDGWDWVRANGIACPLYGSADLSDGFTLHGDRPLESGAPVCHVSYYEADAYARWAGARLPTEFEWEHAHAGAAPRGQFLEDGALHPADPAGDWGGAWNWTASAYAPYPRYRAPLGPVGEYNGKFMCGQMVLRGGSCATPRALARASYRNFFPPAARWQFTGILLARDA